jgi:hypothetical protein
MRKELVLDILGDPISSWETAQGEFPGGQGPGTIEGWQYTHDAKCGFCDFAWLGRYVYFDKEGRVTSKHKRMHYD